MPERSLNQWFEWLKFKMTAIFSDIAIELHLYTQIHKEGFEKSAHMMSRAFFHTCTLTCCQEGFSSREEKFSMKEGRRQGRQTFQSSDDGATPSIPLLVCKFAEFLAHRPLSPLPCGPPVIAVWLEVTLKGFYWADAGTKADVWSTLTEMEPVSFTLNISVIILPRGYENTQTETL